MFVSNTHETSIRPKNSLIVLESFRKPNSSNRNLDSYAVLKLCLAKFEKKLFLSQKCHLPISLCLQSTRIKYPDWKFAHRTRNLQEIECFQLHCGLFLTQKWHLPTYFAVHTKSDDPIGKFADRTRNLQKIHASNRIMNPFWNYMALSLKRGCFNSKMTPSDILVTPTKTNEVSGMKICS
mgnify:FL=1